MRIAYPYYNTTWDGHDYDGERRIASVSISMSRREKRAKRLHTQKGRAKFLKGLARDGYIKPYGCDCRSCMNGWDCCGNFTVGCNDLIHTRRGVRIDQHMSRNI